MSDTQVGPDWWLASDGKWYPPQAPQAFAPPPPPQPFAPLPPAPSAPAVPANTTATWMTLGGAGAVVLGALLPWASVTAPFVGTISKAGTDGDGVITLVLAIIVGVLGLRSMSAVRRKAVIWSIVVAALIAITAVIDMADIKSKFADIPAASASIGIGLWLTLLGAAASVVGGVLQLRSRAAA